MEERISNEDTDAGGPALDATTADALVRSLEADTRFHRDSGLGRVFHPGEISFREDVGNNSLHVLIDSPQLSAHVDLVSPLSAKGRESSRYSLANVAAHNLLGMAQDVVKLARGRQGDHRCELEIEWIPEGDGDGGRWRRSSPAEDDAACSSAQLDVRVAGALDESRLRAALAHALRLSGGVDILQVANCPDGDSIEAARERLQNNAVPLAPPPLRACLARTPGGDIFMVNINHAAADGVGALRVLDAIASAYAGGPDSSPPLEFLAVRDVPVRPARENPPTWIRGYRWSVNRLRDVIARPVLVFAAGAEDRPGFGFHLLTVSAYDTRRLFDDDPGTSKDLLLAALHLAIAQWNAGHGARGGPIAVLVAANLRPPPWRSERVGNFSVTARVTTSERERASAHAALRAVQSQTTRNRRSRSGIALIDALDRSGLLPLWAKQSTIVLRPVNDNHYVDAARLSVLDRRGDAPSFGGEAGQIVEVWFSPPTRTPRALSVGAVMASGALHLAIRYPFHLFGPDAARRFAECFVDQFAVLAGLRDRQKP